MPASKSIGFISEVKVKRGAIACTVEDKDNPNKKHKPCLLGRDSFNTVSLPPINTKVLVEQIDGEKIITKILSAPGVNGIEAAESESGSQEGSGSMSFVFSRDGGSTSESLTIQYTSSGYNITADVQGDITLDSGGSVYIRENGNKKKVATVDHEHNTSDGASTTDTTENHNL